MGGDDWSIDLPNPDEYGKSQSETERLGAAFFRALMVGTSWDKVSRFNQAVVRARLRLLDVEADWNGHLTKAVRFGAAKQDYDAGKHYRSWVAELVKHMRRAHGARKGRLTNQLAAEAQKQAAMSIYQSLCGDRKRPMSKSQASKAVARKLNRDRLPEDRVSPETVRGYLKAPAPKRSSKATR